MKVKLKYEDRKAFENFYRELNPTQLDHLWKKNKQQYTCVLEYEKTEDGKYSVMEFYNGEWFERDIYRINKQTNLPVCDDNQCSEFHMLKKIMESEMKLEMSSAKSKSTSVVDNSSYGMELVDCPLKIPYRHKMALKNEGLNINAYIRSLIENDLTEKGLL